MKIVNVNKMLVFYIATEDDKLYKRIADPNNMDNDLWYIVYDGLDFRVSNHRQLKELKEAYIKYVEDLFDASPCF